MSWRDWLFVYPRAEKRTASQMVENNARKLEERMGVALDHQGLPVQKKEEAAKAAPSG
jgi:hypothetical protein